MEIVEYTLLPDEKETHISIIKDDNGKRIAVVETSEIKVYNTLIRQGWKKNREIFSRSGGLVQAEFEAAANMVTFRNVEKALSKPYPSAFRKGQSIQV